MQHLYAWFNMLIVQSAKLSSILSKTLKWYWMVQITFEKSQFCEMLWTEVQPHKCVKTLLINSDGLLINEVWCDHSRAARGGWISRSWSSRQDQFLPAESLPVPRSCNSSLTHHCLPVTQQRIYCLKSHHIGLLLW